MLPSAPGIIGVYHNKTALYKNTQYIMEKRESNEINWNCPSCRRAGQDRSAH